MYLKKKILSNIFLRHLSLNVCESVFISDLYSVVEWLALGTSIIFVKLKTWGWGTGRGA